MNNPAIVTVAGREVERIDYRQEPVITFKMMDELHERPEGTARRNFNQNRPRFIEGEDFFEVPFEDWSRIPTDDFRTAVQAGQRNPIKLLTQAGYLLLVKSFTDDLSWKVQRELVRAYFVAKGRGRGRKYDPEMERLKRMEREIKAVNMVHKKKDTIRKAAQRILKGETTIEEYAGAAELQDAIREALEAARNAKTPHAETAERFVNAILEHGAGWEDRVDLRTDEGRLWFRMAPVLESLDALGFEFFREDVVPGLREMDGFLPNRTHRFEKGNTKISKKACVITVPKGTEFGERKADQ